MAGFVQQVAQGATKTSNTLTVTLTATTTAGHSLLLVCEATTSHYPTAASDGHNTYHVDVTTRTSHTCSVLRCHLTTALAKTATITITFTGHSNTLYNKVTVLEYSGLKATSPVDKSTSKNGSSVSTITTTSLTPTTSGDLWFTAVAINANTQTPTISTFTRRYVYSGGATYKTQAAADLLTTGKTARSAAWTWTTSANVNAVLVAYKVTASTPVALAGTSSSTSTCSAVLTVGTALTGISTSASTLSANLTTGPLALAGTASSSSSLTGALSAPVALAGTATSSSSCHATLTVLNGVALAGQSTSSSTLSGALAVPIRLAGSSTSASTLSGTLTTGPIALAGISVSTSLATGTITVTKKTRTPFVYASTPRGSPSKPRLVTVERKSDATGDPAHYRRQLVRRPWQSR